MATAAAVVMEALVVQAEPEVVGPASGRSVVMVETVVAQSVETSVEAAAVRRKATAIASAITAAVAVAVAIGKEQTLTIGLAGRRRSEPTPRSQMVLQQKQRCW